MFRVILRKLLKICFPTTFYRMQVKYCHYFIGDLIDHFPEESLRELVDLVIDEISTHSGDPDAMLTQDLTVQDLTQIADWQHNLFVHDKLSEIVSYIVMTRLVNDSAVLLDLNPTTVFGGKLSDDHPMHEWIDKLMSQTKKVLATR